jgi:hypothetical protein
MYSGNWLEYLTKAMLENPIRLCLGSRIEVSEGERRGDTLASYPPRSDIYPTPYQADKGLDDNEIYSKLTEKAVQE